MGGGSRTFKRLFGEGEQKVFCSPSYGRPNPRRLRSATPIRGISRLWRGPFGTLGSAPDFSRVLESFRQAFISEFRALRRDPRRQRVAVLGVFAFSLLVAWLSCLPRELFPEVPYSTVVLSREGELLGARTASDGQWRFPPTDSLPGRYALCLTQFEDRRFYSHHGVDLPAIARAALHNLRAGHTVSGGSTITMQVIRLSRASSSRKGGSGTLPQRSLSEKIIEAILATRLELRCSKNEILALYAAHAPFGGNTVGLEAASQRYFGRSASELSWAEAATLAVLPNSPSLIHPGRNRSLLEAKRNRLLTRIHNIGLIDAQTLELSCAEPLPAKPLPLPQTASHLVEGYRLTNPGQTILSGIDIHLQLKLESSLARWNEEFTSCGIRDLAAVVVDVRSGETIAYCGNSQGPTSSSAIAGKMNLREGAQVDIAASPRSTGSVLKPLLYCAMLQNGDILPHTLIPDIPLNAGGFTPQNFDLQFSGAVAASEALARSLNVPFVRMLRDYGVRNFKDLLTSCGMTTLSRPSEDYGLSLILGGAEGKLCELTKIYALLSAYYQGFTDYLPSDWPLTDRCAIWWTFDALKELNRPDELDKSLVSSLRRIAWKTGTSYGFRDAWAIGVTRDYAVGVWAGNANGESAPGLVGARTAGPVLFDIYNMLPSGEWFSEPSSGDYVYAEVCRKSGQLKGQFCTESDSLAVPPAALRSKACPYHKPVLLTSDGSHRLQGPAPGCVTGNFFILPPAMEWYYRRTHSDYVPLPPLLPGSLSSGNFIPMAFIYPEQGSSIFIPKKLDGSEGEVVFNLAHSNPETDVYWHLDSEYIGSTRFIHRLSLRPSRGSHSLTAVDESGNSVSVSFRVEN